MNIGKVIRELRGKRGWTQDELAFKIGTTPANLSRIESDKHGPSSDLLSSIAFVFGIKVYELIALTEGVQVGQVAGIYSAEEEALLRCFRKMHQEERALFQAIGESFCRVRRSRGESIRNSDPDSQNSQPKT
ncbi:MAG: helix-turn-helix transcriptional regulator [Sulfuritalea sp.]|jgi:transcriptional regulator with XRE-family HTH domain|nr:helix-turn-helix transcriptional regulator [Sulfuritalea sp.]